MSLVAWLIRRTSRALGGDYAAALEETLARRLEDARAVGCRERLRVLGRELAGLMAVVVSDGWRRARERRRQRRCDAAWKAGRMEGLALEVRQSARRLLKSPIFSL